jgi:hypothetical protein
MVAAAAPQTDEPCAAIHKTEVKGEIQDTAGAIHGNTH